MGSTDKTFAQTAVGLLAIGFLLTAVALLVIGWSAGTAAGAADKRTCGIEPGDGAFNFLQTRNVSCRIAQKVSNKAGRKFCGKQFQHCNRPPGGGFDTGDVKAKRWSCDMKVGWEFYRARCDRQRKSFVHKAGS